ncbi:MAG: response regulator [Calditrichaeota bacterium]|nr:MAG: response regulator [Calditrichota bacterium]
MGEKKVLVVEDEEYIATLIKEILRRTGTEAVVTSRAEEALSVLENQEHPDLAIVDVSLPDMNGLELYRTIRERFPSLNSRFLFMSGYTPEDDLIQLVQNSENRFIQKPFHLLDLQKTIENML